MSMLDAFFSKGFKAAKCKTLLKLTIPRIKLLRNRREIQLKQMRRDIAQLLENGQEATARIRVEHIIREVNMLAAQEIIELFCELIAVRLPIIETQRECPLDLKEAISSICFAAPRCSDLPELLQAQMMFAGKYGKEFVTAAAELMPDCGVNRQIIELLSVRAPSVEAKLKLLKEIAEEYEVDWDPAASKTELLKVHEDLLNGPSNIISGSAMPLPKEKHDDSASYEEHTEKHHEEASSDAGFGSLDLPEVPRVSVRLTTVENSSMEHSDPELSKSKPPKDSEQIQFIPFTFPPDFSASSPSVQSDPASHHDHARRFVASPPPPPPFMSPSEQSDPGSVHRDPNLSSVVSRPPLARPFSLSSEQGDPTPYLARDNDTTPSLPNEISEASIDLLDVLTAAQAAAETADRAAAAARAAASLAQLRIAELITKKNDNNKNCDTSQKNSSAVGYDAQQHVAEQPTFDQQQNSFDYTDHIGPFQGFDSSEEVAEMGGVHSDAKDLFHQPRRSISIEDYPYFSYPNLFSRQDSELKPAPGSNNH